MEDLNPFDQFGKDLNSSLPSVGPAAGAPAPTGPTSFDLSVAPPSPVQPQQPVLNASQSSMYGGMYNSQPPPGSMQAPPRQGPNMGYGPPPESMPPGPNMGYGLPQGMPPAPLGPNMGYGPPQGMPPVPPGPPMHNCMSNSFRGPPPPGSMGSMQNMNSMGMGGSIQNLNPRSSLTMSGGSTFGNASMTNSLRGLDTAPAPTVENVWNQPAHPPPPMHAQQSNALVPSTTQSNPYATMLGGSQPNLSPYPGQPSPNPQQQQWGNMPPPPPQYPGNMPPPPPQYPGNMPPPPPQYPGTPQQSFHGSMPPQPPQYGAPAPSKQPPQYGTPAPPTAPPPVPFSAPAPPEEQLPAVDPNASSSSSMWDDFLAPATQQQQPPAQESFNSNDGSQLYQQTSLPNPPGPPSQQPPPQFSGGNDMDIFGASSSSLPPAPVPPQPPAPFAPVNDSWGSSFSAPAPPPAAPLSHPPSNALVVSDAPSDDPFGIFGRSAPAPAPVAPPQPIQQAIVPAPPQPTEQAIVVSTNNDNDMWADMGFDAPVAAAHAPVQIASVPAQPNTLEPELKPEEPPKKKSDALPPGGEWYDARIFTPTLGVMFFKPQELTDSLFLQTDPSTVEVLQERPVVAFIVEGSSARSAGVELGHVLLKVNGIDVKSPKEASRLIKEGPRPLPLLFYVPDTQVVVAEGEHMVKYDTRETGAPPSAKDWKPKYVVIGGIIAQPWMMNMYRSKSEYDIAVIETQARRPVSVKVKQFSLQGARIQNDWQGPQMVKYKNKLHPWKYVVVLPVARNPIKMSSPNLSQLKPVHEGVRRVLLAQQRGSSGAGPTAAPVRKADPYKQDSIRKKAGSSVSHGAAHEGGVGSIRRRQQNGAP